MYTIDVVVAAAGRGKRVGAAQNKLLLNLNQNSDRDEKAGEEKETKSNEEIIIFNIFIFPP